MSRSMLDLLILLVPRFQTQPIEWGLEKLQNISWEILNFARHLMSTLLIGQELKVFSFVQ